jgi:RimJ/RimL family protein N-acetyltransferase
VDIMTGGASEIRLRPWRRADVAAIVRYANNPEIAKNLRDLFPHPYTRKDAENWVAYCEAQDPPPYHLAIELENEAIGGIGFEPLEDVHRFTGEIGYWIGEPFWGRGIATEAVRMATNHGFSVLGLERIQATVFEWNAASARVLEKCGYLLEGRLRRSIFKDGRFAGSLLYALIRDRSS